MGKEKGKLHENTCSVAAENNCTMHRAAHQGLVPLALSVRAAILDYSFTGGVAPGYYLSAFQAFSVHHSPIFPFALIVKL